MRKARFWILYLLAVAVVFEVTLQGFYWINAGQSLFTRVDKRLWREEPLAGFGMKVDLAMTHATDEFATIVHTNSRGFRVSERHEEYSHEKPVGRFRVLLLGPSFAFGWGVNHADTMAARLEELLRRSAFVEGGDLEVINAGVSSMPPVPQLRWLEGEGLRYSPDLVVQLVYGSMAVDTASDPGIRVDAQGRLVHRDATVVDHARGVLRRSAIVFYTWFLSVRLRGALAGDAAGGDVEGAGRSLILHDRFDPEAPSLRPALDYYRNLQAKVAEAGARLIVAYLPLSYAVHRQDIARWRHSGVTDPDRAAAFDEAFCSHLNTRGIECVDMSADLRRAAAAGVRTYFLVDIHWTPAGNLVAAEAVARQIRARPAVSP
jgi:hypothetical protein